MVGPLKRGATAGPPAGVSCRTTVASGSSWLLRMGLRRLSTRCASLHVASPAGPRSAPPLTVQRALGGVRCARPHTLRLPGRPRATGIQGWPGAETASRRRQSDLACGRMP
eukprot:3446188-Alexandrium_andersonii.AAC.1